MVTTTLTEKDVKKNFVVRLQRLAKAWQRLAEPTLKHRRKLLDAYASGYYSGGYSRKHLINLIDRGVNTVVPFLVEGNPRVLVETKVASLRGWAYTVQLALNHLINKMDLAENAFIPAAINSMFGMGIARTSSVYDRVISVEDEVIRVGTPYVDIIDDSNYIGDISAKRRRDFAFEGDIYRLPTTYAKDLFAGKDKGGNQIADYISADGRLIEEYSPREVSSQDFDVNRFSLREYTTLIDLYLYDENIVITILPEGRKAKILRTIEVDTPFGSPYDVLGYKYFPESPIPKPPTWDWHDMDVTINILADKMQEQAENQKDIIAYSASAEKDMKKVAATPNLGTVQVDDVEALKQLSFGGANPLNYQWFNLIKAEFPQQGVNPNILGGREAQAPTLGQEQLLYSNATRIIGSMNTRYQAFMISILKKVGWEAYNDPMQYIPGIKSVPGVIDLPIVFTKPENVEDFYEFIFDIVPYSAQRTSPEIQYQKLSQFLTQWILPIMPLAAQQGVTVDFDLVTKILAEYGGFGSFNQWWKSAVPHELESIDYRMMQTTKRKGGKFGQAGDAFGATMGSKQANLEQQQARTKKEPVAQGAK